MFQQADRMKGLSSAIFTQVDTMRRQAIAEGQDVITLSLGSPDLAPAPHIVEAMKKANSVLVRKLILPSTSSSATPKTAQLVVISGR